MPSRLVERGAALGLLVGVLAAVGALVWSGADSYAEVQREIADKRAQLRDLRALAEARTAFARLTRKGDDGSLILPAGGDPQQALAAAVGRAAEGRQVLVDGLDSLPAEATEVSATVRLRGTQGGLYGFLHAIEDGTPYLVVTRLDVDTFRAADVERGKPLILRADLRVAAFVAPTPVARPQSARAP